MCELLIQKENKNDFGNVYNDCKLPKRGDVIVAMPDGWEWSDTETLIFELRKFPGISVSHAEPLLSGEISPTMSLTIANPMLQFRGFYLDLDVEMATIEEMTQKRSSRQDPTTIG